MVRKNVLSMIKQCFKYFILFYFKYFITENIFIVAILKRLLRAQLGRGRPGI